MKYLAFAILFCCTFSIQAQNNQIDTTGNVGIGTTSPVTPLEVVGSSSLRGNVAVDSSITIGDSMVVERDVKIKNDLRVDGKGIFEEKIRTKKSIVADKNAIIKKDLIMQGYADSITDFGILFLDEDGRTYPVNKTMLKPIIDEIVYEPQPCLQDGNGNAIYLAPTWHNTIPNTLYTGVGNCENFAKVGINTNTPQGYLHIKGFGTSADDRLLIIENNDNPNGNPILLQLDANGLLHAREMKVDLSNAWPDYVFDDGYVLMPLSEVEKFINKNGHLPNVKSADQIKKEGLNLGETNKMLMEKIEEMTLYMIQLEKKVNALEKKLNDKND